VQCTSARSSSHVPTGSLTAWSVSSDNDSDWVGGWVGGNRRTSPSRYWGHNNNTNDSSLTNNKDGDEETVHCLLHKL
jgi:hypothetical protein